MRYYFNFFFLTLPKTLLSPSTIHATFVTVLILLLGTFARVFTGVLSAPASTVSLSMITGLADHHLVMTTQALKKTCGVSNRL